MIDNTHFIKKRIALLLLVLVLIFATYQLFTWGRLTVTLSSIDSDVAHIRIISQSDDIQVSNSSTNKDNLTKFLKSGKYEVTVSNADGRQATSYFVTVPRFLSSANLSASLQNQVTREKLARDVAACPVMSGSKLYSYNCAGSGEIHRHAPTNAKRYATKETTPGNFLAIEQYKEGMLTLALHLNRDQRDQLVLTYSEGGQVKKEVEFPDNFISESYDYRLAVDRANNEGFVVSRDKNTSFLVYKDIDSTPMEHNITHETKIPLNLLNSSLDVFDGEVMTVVGKSGYSPHSEEEDEELSTKEPTQIKLYTPGDDSPKTTHTLAKEFQGVEYCSEEFLCFLDDNKLTLYDLSDGFHKKATLYGIDSFVKLDKSSFAYLKNRQVLRFNTENLEADLLYSSENFRASSINFASNGVLVNAFMPDEDPRTQVAHTFLLGTAPADENTFIDDTLPYTSSTFDMIRDSDYHGKTILIDVFLDSWESPFSNSTEFTYDRKELADKRKFLLKQLSEAGINTSGFNITIRP